MTKFPNPRPPLRLWHQGASGWGGSNGSELEEWVVGCGEQVEVYFTTLYFTLSRSCLRSPFPHHTVRRGYLLMFVT